MAVRNVPGSGLGDRCSITWQCCDSTAQNDLQNDYECSLPFTSVDTLTRDSSDISSKITYSHTVTFRKARNLRYNLYFWPNILSVCRTKSVIHFNSPIHARWITRLTGNCSWLVFGKSRLQFRANPAVVSRPKERCNSTVKRTQSISGIYFTTALALGVLRHIHLRTHHRIPLNYKEIMCDYTIRFFLTYWEKWYFFKT